MDALVKKKMFELLYNDGDVNILITITGNGVRIPASITAGARDKLVGFLLGKRPSPRLEISEKGLFAPLRFGNERFRCFFPWDSILQMNSTDCAVFFAKEEKEESALPEKKKGRPRLTVVRKETAG